MSKLICLTMIALTCCACQCDHLRAGFADDFPIMCWEPPRKVGDRFSHPHTGLSSLRDCGFTTIGFVRPKDLPECERLGLRAIVRPEAGQVEWQKLSDQQIEQTVRALITESGNSPAIL